MRHLEGTDSTPGTTLPSVVCSRIAPSSSNRSTRYIDFHCSLAKHNQTFEVFQRMIPHHPPPHQRAIPIIDRARWRRNLASSCRRISRHYSSNTVGFGRCLSDVFGDSGPSHRSARRPVRKRHGTYGPVRSTTSWSSQLCSWTPLLSRRVCINGDRISSIFENLRAPGQAA